MKEQRRDSLCSVKSLSRFWIIGCAVGVVIALLFSGQYAEAYSAMQIWVYDTVKEIKYNQSAYFILNFKSRGKELLVLFFLSFTVFSTMYKVLFCFWKGIVIGFIYAAAVKFYSVSGVFLGVAYTLPQGIFYGLGIIGMLWLSKRLEEKELFSGNKKALWIWNILPMLLFCIICIGIGAYIEGNINLMLLKRALKRCI